MKLYLCTQGTNYGLGCCVISAKDIESANKIANEDKTGLIWDRFEINEIVPSDKEEILKIDFYNHN